MRVEASDEFERGKPLGVWSVDRVLFHEHLIRSIRAGIIKAELDKETHEVGMLFYVSVYENVFAGVFGSVAESGLQEKLTNLAPTDVMTNLKCAEL